jgi:2,3-bisphosphoglycerate-independent phosphoglycerate mutase
VIDGWGIPSESSPKDGDAIAAAKTPVMDDFKEHANGYTELEASSLAVGLPEGLMGNSEVGHLNIGAGRVVWQDVVRIDQTIRKGELNKNEVIMKTFEDAKNRTGRLHLAGLISDGGVVSSDFTLFVSNLLILFQHSKQDHLYALLKVAKEVGVPHVYVHFFGDGRDTDPKSGAGYMQQLLDKMKEIGIGQVATVVGRYYAMDRDKRWERIEVAMNAMCIGDGKESSDPVKTIKERYEKGENDEFLKPIIVSGKEARVKGKAPYATTLMPTNLFRWR